MRIVPFPDFSHAGSLRGFFGSQDPRQALFQHPQVDVDLRECQFVRPPAALWCAIYPLLVRQRGVPCTLLVPTNEGVCIYLKSLGLFDTLKEHDVDVDDRGIRDTTDSQLILPLTVFNTEFQVEDATNRAQMALQESGLGAANIYPVVSETFAELAMNAVQHAESPIGAFGFVQFYQSEFGRRFVCGVADGGIGIRRSLERNPDMLGRVPYDWVAIEEALKERVSGTADSARGIGLYGVVQDMRQPGRQLMIHSGIGLLRISEDMMSEARRTKLFPGTLAYASIST